MIVLYLHRGDNGMVAVVPLAGAKIKQFPHPGVGAIGRHCQSRPQLAPGFQLQQHGARHIAATGLQPLRRQHAYICAGLQLAAQ